MRPLVAILLTLVLVAPAAAQGPQSGFEQKPFHRALAELGGYDCGNTDHMVTETLIRGMYNYWRKVMEV